MYKAVTGIGFAGICIAGILFATMGGGAATAANPGGVNRDTGPDFDCMSFFLSAVQKTICTDAGLMELDRELAADFRRRINTIPDIDRQNFLSGVRAWLEERDTVCRISDDRADADCIRTMYWARLSSLKQRDASADTTLYDLGDSGRWIQLASDATKERAVERAKVFHSQTGRDIKVFLANNGWFAVTTGVVPTIQVPRILTELSIAIPDFDPATFASSGGKYLNLVYNASSDVLFAYAPSQPVAPRVKSVPAVPATRRIPQPAPVPSSPAQPQTVVAGSSFGSVGTNGARCSRASVKERQAACYIFAGGERACSEALDEASEGGSSFLAGALGGGMCSAAASKIANGMIDENMLVMSALLGSIDNVGAGMMQSENPLANLFGGAMRLVVGATQFGIAQQCAQAEADNCGY